MKKIESATNPYFKTLKKLLKTSGIKKEGLALVMGQKIINEILYSTTERTTPSSFESPYKKIHVHSILISEKMEISGTMEPKKIIILRHELFNELDVFGTKAPLLVVKTPEIPKWSKVPPKGLELFLPISDPSNLGAILRSAIAFDTKKVVLLQECAHPLHPKAIKASSGMSLMMNYEVGPSIKELHKELEENSISKSYISLDGSGKSMELFQWPKDLFLIAGEEGQGLPEELKENSISIAMNDFCESLNVTVASSIALHHYHTFHSLQG